MTIKRIDLGWVTVASAEKSKKFFHEILGLKLDEYDQKINWLELSGTQGGAKLGVMQKNDFLSESIGTNAILCLKVDDIAATKKELEQKGVQFLGEIFDTGHVKLAMFTDYDGNKFQLVEEAETKT